MALAPPRCAIQRESAASARSVCSGAVVGAPWGRSQSGSGAKERCEPRGQRPRPESGEVAVEFAVRGGEDGDDAGRARVETELGYGLGVRWGEAGVLTPYGGFGYEEGGARRYRLGTRLDLGGAVDLSLEANARKAAPTPSTASDSNCASGGRAFGSQAATGAARTWNFRHSRASR